MYRVILAATSVLFLAGCSMGTSAISSGFAGPGPTASIKPRLRPSTTLGGVPRSRTTRKSRNKSRKADKQLASLGRDAAPSGSYKTLRRGSLDKRNYRGVHLDIEKARKLINAYRQKKGLRALSVDVKLTKAAKGHSRDLARWDRISHYGSDGSNPWDRVKRSGYNARLAAENVGTGQNTIEEVFKGWQKSPGHNKNLLLADAKHMGLALVHDPKTEFKTFWTLVVGARM